MPGNRDALLDATVGDVSDLELRIAARRELGECITSTDESTVSRALDRFARVKHSTRPDLWRWILLGVVLILSLSMGASHVTSGVIYNKALTGNIWDYYEESLNSARKNLGQQGWTRQQKAFLFGDFAGMSLDERLRHLRQMAEQDPAMLGEYVRVHLNKTSSLPPDLQDLASKIDPDNAIFDYFKAALLAKDSVKEPEKLSLVIASLTDATAKPAFNSYLREAIARRTALLPLSTRKERLLSANFILSSPFPALSLVHLSQAICVEAQRLAVADESEAFTRLAAMTETYWLRRLADDDPSILSRVVLEGEIGQTCEAFISAAGKLGLAAEEKRYLAIKDDLKNRWAARKAREKLQTGREPLAIKTGIEIEFVGMPSYLVVEPPPVDEQLLQPTLYADHALYSRALTLALWALLGLSAGILMIHYATAPRMIRTTGRQIARLLNWKDYAIIAVISFLLPVTYVMAVSRLTPYGARELNLKGTFGLMPAAHFASLFIMMVMLAILVAQWRMRRRTAFFGLGQGWPTIITWTALVAAALHVPLIGWYVTRDTVDKVTLYSIFVLLVPGLISFGSFTVKSSFGSFRRRLCNDVLVRVLIPSLGLIMIGTLPLLPLFETEENYWFRQDRFVVNLEDRVFPFTYEKAVAERFNEEIRQILERE